MTETIEDSPEMSGVLFRVAVCSFLRTVRKLYPYMSSLQKVMSCNELLFDKITCLIAALSRATAQRATLTGGLQIDWGGREVSPSYRQLNKTPYRTIHL